MGLLLKGQWYVFCRTHGLCCGNLKDGLLTPAVRIPSSPKPRGSVNYSYLTGPRGYNP